MYLALSVKYLEFIALFQQPFYGPGQGVFHVFLCLDGVMESNDGAIPHIKFYLPQYLATIQLVAIVTGNQVPHYNLVFMPQHHVLHPAHVAMWRTEQVGMDQLVCFVRIGQIVLASVFESPDMVKSMISQKMSPFYHHLEFLGMLATIVAHQKEGSLDIVLV